MVDELVLVGSMSRSQKSERLKYIQSVPVLDEVVVCVKLDCVLLVDDIELVVVFAVDVDVVAVESLGSRLHSVNIV